MEPNIYDALCKALSDRAGQVDWAAFSAADWDRFAKRAVAEGVGPLIHWTLKGSKEPAFTPAAVPPSALQTLAEAYYQSAAHNALLFKELERILEALGEAGIPVIVLKGAALAQTLYPDPALRPMGDLDLLVPINKLSQAASLVQATGYNVAMMELRPGLNQAAGYHLHLRSSQPANLALELHWTLIGSEDDWRTVPAYWFWDNSEPWAITQSQQHNGIHQLSPLAHLLYLAAHLTLQHGSAQAILLWFFDLHLMISRQDDRLDWGTLIKQAIELGWGPALLAAVRETQSRLNTPISDPNLQILEETAQTKLDQWIKYRAKPNFPRSAKAWHKFASSSRSNRLRWGWAILFPSSAHMQWRYNPRSRWLLPFYYFYRWAEIIQSDLATRSRPTYQNTPDKSQ